MPIGSLTAKIREVLEEVVRPISPMIPGHQKLLQLVDRDRQYEPNQRDHEQADIHLIDGECLPSVPNQVAEAAVGADHFRDGDYSGEEILACDNSGIAVTLPKPMTSGMEARSRFGKQDFVYLADEDVYRCPAGKKLSYHYTNEEDGQQLRRYWTNVCSDCALKPCCTSGKERRITRREHEHVLEAVQQRLDRNPQAMRQRRETVEHPFGTLTMRIGATHFLMKRLPKVASEMALHVLAYNLTRVMNIIDTQPLIAAIRA